MKRVCKVVCVCAVVVVAVVLGLHWAKPAAQTETRWTMINVAPGLGQADCHLIEFPNGKRVLIDIADGSDARGTALAFLRKRGINHIDLVVISHFHLDHYGKLRDLINTGIRVDRVALNVPVAEVGNRESIYGSGWDTIQSLLRFLREKGVPYFTPKPGDRLIKVPLSCFPDSPAFASLDVISLYDGLHTPIGKTDVNDTSIILRLSDGPTRALFTGDLNYRMGMYMAQHNFDLAADILKVPHHGAEHSAPDEFFERVNPKAALVPSPKTLWWSLRSKRIRTFFQDHHIPTYVSGINGNVTVHMTADGFTIQAER